MSEQAAPQAPGDSPLVVAEGLVKLFRVGRSRLVRAVDGVSFSIKPGESFGLVGESGSGKSTVARAILRLEQPDEGRVLFDGVDVLTLKQPALRALRRSMQIVFQDPYSSLNRRHTIERLLMAPMVAHGFGVARREARVRELLSLVGLDASYAPRYAHQLSGGQSQRVAIARALALEPRFVVLDEAVSALDVSIQAQVLNLLRDLQRRLGLTYLFISHDLAVIRYMCQTIAVMHRGRIVESGAREVLFENPRHEYTRALIGAIPVVDASSPSDQAGVRR